MAVRTFGKGSVETAVVGGRPQVGGYWAGNSEMINKVVLRDGGSMAADSGRDWGVGETLEVVESIAYVVVVVVDTVAAVMVVPPEVVAAGIAAVVVVVVRQFEVVGSKDHGGRWALYFEEIGLDGGWEGSCSAVER